MPGLGGTRKSSSSSTPLKLSSHLLFFATLIPLFSLLISLTNATSNQQVAAAPPAKGKEPTHQQHQQQALPPQAAAREQWPPVSSYGGGIYYEEPNNQNMPVMVDGQDVEALAAAIGYEPGYPDIVGLNEVDGDALFPLEMESGEAALPQNFGDMESIVGPDDSSEANNFFELPSSIGQTAGLAVDLSGNLVLFHRSGREWDQWSFDKSNRFNRSLGPIANSTIAVLDTATGKVISEHGRGLFYMPHGLSIDSQGNLWVTDVGSHQVVKLDAKSYKPMMVLGEKMVPGGDGKHFCQPTDVAVAKSGEFFVADGYCNARVMKFDKEGNFVSSFGGPNSGTSPKIGEFFVPHSLALIEDLNLLCVADRENERIQCFAAGLNDDNAHHPRAYIPTGTFFTKAEKIGRVYAIREKQHYLVGVTNKDQREQVEPQIFVMDMNTGRANTFAKGLENAHAVALSDHGDIYVAQMNPNQIVKFSVPRDEEAE